MQKQIVAVNEKFVNYLFHILAVARISYHSEYAVVYKNSVKPQDLDYLEEVQELLQFGNGEGGKLKELFIFFPAYINPQTTAEITDYFTLIDQCVQKNDYKTFFKRYEKELKRLEEWVYGDIERFLKTYFSELKRYRDDVKTLSKIYLENYQEFLKSVWSVEEPKIAKRVEELNQLLSENDLITKWEEMTGLEFKFDTYQISLCSATLNGPNANSLGYERNVFHYNYDMCETLHMISHEVGTHILIDLVKKFQGIYHWKVVYMGYESLAKFLNEQVLQDEKIGYRMPQYHEEIFFNLFYRISMDYPELSIEEMFSRALEVYRA